MRKWNTEFRGEFFIHASKVSDRKAMEKYGFPDLPCGCIVGKAKLVEVKQYKNGEEYSKDKDLHLSSKFHDCYGFVLEDVIRVKEVPCKGNLNFWDFKFEGDW